VWKDGIKPVLILNKLDRLILELKLSPLEAYQHLQRLLEQVNAVIGSFFTQERIQEDYDRRREMERRAEIRARGVESELEGGSTHDGGTSDPGDDDDDDDDDLYFSPDKGNVVFTSALHGWGFRLDDFAKIFATRMGVNSKLLGRVLWGDYFFDNKTKKVIGRRRLQGRNLKPLFVSLFNLGF
jgi:ribosome assembly protein 1